MPRSTIVLFLIASRHRSRPGSVAHAGGGHGHHRLRAAGGRRDRAVPDQADGCRRDRSDLVHAQGPRVAEVPRRRVVRPQGPLGRDAGARGRTRSSLRPGESFTMDARVRLPEALTATPVRADSPVGRQRPPRGASQQRDQRRRCAPRRTRRPRSRPARERSSLELWPDKAPNHVANFLTLAKNGFYDGRIFHRVISGFMIQTGCPLGTGMGDPGYKIAAEFNDAPFVKGTLGMARGQSNDSAGSQFFICVADRRRPRQAVHGLRARDRGPGGRGQDLDGAARHAEGRPARSRTSR